MTRTPDPDNFPEWLKTHPWPELQGLIDRFGGYNRISPEGWAKYYVAVEAWEAARKARLVRVR